MTRLEKFVSSEFVPMRGMENRHVMTIMAGRWFRPFPQMLREQKELIVEVHEHAKVLVECNFTEEARIWLAKREAGGPGSESASGGDPRPRTIAIILHGLEGSSRSHYVLGMAQKLVASGISAARMNMRNCGGTMHLSKTLYNAGLSSDLVLVAEEFLAQGFENVFFIGTSLGGNLVLKAAAELSKVNAPWLKGVCAVAPALDLHACISAIEQGFNRIYERNFLRLLKAKIRAKEKMEAGRFNVQRLRNLWSLRTFDDLYTAPDGGYKSADEYYARASALSMIPMIDIPVLILTAQDDPIVPFETLQGPALKKENISLVAPVYGGHAGFIGKLNGHAGSLRAGNGASPPVVAPSDRFWAETVCTQFLNHVLSG